MSSKSKRETPAKWYWRKRQIESVDKLIKVEDLGQLMSGFNTFNYPLPRSYANQLWLASTKDMEKFAHRYYVRRQGKFIQNFKSHQYSYNKDISFQYKMGLQLVRKDPKSRYHLAFHCVLHMVEPFKPGFSYIRSWNVHLKNFRKDGEIKNEDQLMDYCIETMKESVEWVMQGCLEHYP